MAEPLKTSYGPPVVRQVAAAMAAVHPAFDTEGFVADTLVGYEALELMTRARQIATQLARHLPADFARTGEILLASFGPPLGTPMANGMAPFFYLPHGAIMNNTSHGAEMNRWTPDKIGRDFDFKPILEPFKPVQKYMTVVSGLGNKPGESSAVHAIVPATWLSAVHPRQSHAPLGGVTVASVTVSTIELSRPNWS